MPKAKDLDAQVGADHDALLLPEGPLAGDQAGAQDGQERVVREAEVLLEALHPTVLLLHLRGLRQRALHCVRSGDGEW